MEGGGAACYAPARPGVNISAAPFFPASLRFKLLSFSDFPALFLRALCVKSLKQSTRPTAPALVNNPETFPPSASLLNEPTTGGNQVFLIAALLAAAITYEAVQSLNRFANLTRDDVPKSEKRSQNARGNLTASLLL
jgi:hypothetical protein